MEDEVTEHVNRVLVTYRNPYHFDRIKDPMEPRHGCHFPGQQITHTNNAECCRHDFELRQLHNNGATCAVRNSAKIGNGSKEHCVLQEKEVGSNC